MEAQKLPTRAPRQPYQEPPSDGACQQLQDMRHVYLNSKYYDSSEAEKAQRKFQEKDPKGFQVQLSSLEKEHRLAKKADKPSSPDKAPEAQEDLGAHKCMELAERLIEELT